MSNFNIVSFATGALTLVSALAINDAVKEGINSVYPVANLKSVEAKVLYAITIIIASIIIIITIIKLNEKATEIDKRILDQNENQRLYDEYKLQRFKKIEDTGGKLLGVSR